MKFRKGSELMSYYDEILGDDLSTLENKKSKYITYKSKLSTCIDKLDNYDTDDCYESLVYFKLDDISFANNKFSLINDDLKTLRDKLKNELKKIALDRIDIIDKRIDEVVAAQNAANNSVTAPAVPTEPSNPSAEPPVTTKPSVPGGGGGGASGPGSPWNGNSSRISIQN